ncbi:efflux RND transporter periplasmic adaptor subunit [Psychromonas sp.]|uniref:efflux RND transporter periplasmic adaptor subunit n=1 Tax=Psychromonas sp. TaxID=1884585 RepID=UPI0039E49AE9
MNKQILRALWLAAITLSASYHSLLAAQESSAKKDITAVAVHTQSVTSEPISQSLSLIGKLQSDQFVNIATEVSGKVKSIDVQANQQVKTGQLLFSLDDSKAQAAMLEAKAYFLDEQRKLLEFRKLVKSNAVSQTALDGQTASVDIARARLKAAQTEVDNHVLSAPFAGTIGLIDFSLGKMVATGSELLTLDNLAQMTLDLQVPDRYLSMLGKGMPVTATNRAWPETVFNGELTATDSRINEDTLNLRIRVLFANPDNKLKPGMMMSARMVFPAINAAVIPVQALEYSGTKRYIYIVNQQGMAKRQEVLLGARIKNQVVIEKGVEIGEQIVVQGLVNMRDGLKVKDLSRTDKLEKSSTKMQDNK